MNAVLKALNTRTAKHRPHLQEQFTLDYDRRCLTVLSFGAGQDSTDILYRYTYDPQFRARYAPGRFIVTMSDTGNEHPYTYWHVAQIKVFCRQHGIEFHLLTPGMGFHSSKWPSLPEFYQRTRTVGSKAFRKSCSDNLKIQPFYRWLDKFANEELGTVFSRKRALVEYARCYGKIRVLVGLAAGEEARIADAADAPVWRQMSIETVYPLVELGIDRRGCQEHIRSLGHEVPWPSNCMMCPFLSKIELLWLYRRFPHAFAEWVMLEQQKLEKFAHKGDANYTVWGKSRKTLPEVLAEAEGEFGHMTEAELDHYKMSHGHCVMTHY